MQQRLRRSLSLAALVLCSRPVQSALLYPFSWDTLQVFAFPGAAPRFMTEGEVAYFTANFSNILIWGLNATCMGNDGSTFAASCASSRCACPADRPEDQQFVLNMEGSLQEQGRRLKAAAAGDASYFVLGYIEGLSAQKYYVAQGALLTPNSPLSSALLSTKAKGLIDCYTDGCNWQGVEYRQYDLRQPAVRQYYVQQVIGSLINSTGLDGSFIDVIDWWQDVCAGSWGCTAQETQDLVNASLQATEEMLQAASAAGKILSISCHSTLSEHAAYYAAHTAILARYPTAAIRFWEFFTPTEDSLASLMYEAGTLGLATHVHVTTRTLAPDWVELAVFLLGMGEHSYFSYSGPWMLDSFAVYPEYSRALGQPLGAAVNATVQKPYSAWQLIAGQNLVYGLPSCPTCNVTGVLTSFGTVPTAQDCLAAVMAASAPASYTAMSWVEQDGSEWGRHCYGRLDSFNASACINEEAVGAPCYASAQAGHVSAVAQPWARIVRQWSRSFQHVDVTWSSDEGNATIAWQLCHGKLLMREGEALAGPSILVILIETHEELPLVT